MGLKRRRLILKQKAYVIHVSGIVKLSLRDLRQKFVISKNQVRHVLKDRGEIIVKYTNNIRIIPRL